MAGKVLSLLLPVSIAALVASQWRELVRYFKIEQMDFGAGHPELVPAEGERGYPCPGRGASDGTGEFDSASRGGGPRSPRALKDPTET
jgi:hypothetical protein